MHIIYLLFTSHHVCIFQFRSLTYFFFHLIRKRFLLEITMIWRKSWLWMHKPKSKHMRSGVQTIQVARMGRTAPVKTYETLFPYMASNTLESFLFIHYIFQCHFEKEMVIVKWNYRPVLFHKSYKMFWFIIGFNRCYENQFCYRPIDSIYI